MSEVKHQSVGYWSISQEQQNGIIVKLYGTKGGVVHPVVKLFDTSLEEPEQDLSHIPDGLYKLLVKAGISDVRADLKKDDAIAQKQAFPLDPPIDFYVRVNEDGSISKRVAWTETKQAWAGEPVGFAGEAGSEQAYIGFTELDKKKVELVDRETFEIARQTLYSVDALYKEIDGDDELDELEALDADELFKTLFYHTARTFARVRGSIVLSIDRANQALKDDFAVIKAGLIDTLATDIASGHYLIADDEEVRGIINKLDIPLTQKHVDEIDERVQLARQVWLYVDLIEKYDYTDTQAAEAITEHFEQIPW